MRWLSILCCALLFTSFVKAQQAYILVLGTAQDGGYPQAGCAKSCCKKVYTGEEKKRLVTCLALIDPIEKKSWLFDATPDFGEQLRLLRLHLKDSTHLPSGIFLTHAHIGHYGGLMQLGKEVMGTKEIPVFAMPRMTAYLNTNGPWSQLVTQKNIVLTTLGNNTFIQLNPRISIQPIRVPHRDEYSETVGFHINYSNKKALFIPDIDKWEKWDYPLKVYPGKDSVTALLAILTQYDHVIIDGTFYRNGELPGRDMRDIPHPFVEESMQLFQSLSASDKKRISFIHFNHTNPLMWDMNAQKTVKQNGFYIAEQNTVLP